MLKSVQNWHSVKPFLCKTWTQGRPVSIINSIVFFPSHLSWRVNWAIDQTTALIQRRSDEAREKKDRVNIFILLTCQEAIHTERDVVESNGWSGPGPIFGAELQPEPAEGQSCLYSLAACGQLDSSRLNYVGKNMLCSKKNASEVWLLGGWELCVDGLFFSVFFRDYTHFLVPREILLCAQ